MSITASNPTVLEEMLLEIKELRSRLHTFHAGRDSPNTPAIDPAALVAVELNTSCPNIKDTPPPSYNFPFLLPFLDVLASAYYSDPSLTIGLKLPPYLYMTRFQDVVRSLSNYSRPEYDGTSINPFSFVTCTNTLGSCLLFTDETIPSETLSTAESPFALPTPLGGLGGESLHPLSLGNVYTFTRLFAQHSDPAMQKIKVVGVGGVTTREACQRMTQAGASVVACATLLGRQGVKAFETLSA